MLLNRKNLIHFFGIQPDYNPGVDHNDKKNNIWLEGTVFSGLDAFIVAAQKSLPGLDLLPPRSSPLSRPFLFSKYNEWTVEDEYTSYRGNTFLYSFIKVINMVFSCKATEHTKEAAR